jgi:hypothetical protein
VTCSGGDVDHGGGGGGGGGGVAAAVEGWSLRKMVPMDFPEKTSC